MNNPICFKCKVEMKESTAIKNGLSGMGDFSSKDAQVTLSPDSQKISIINCFKCPNCGKSISK